MAKRKTGARTKLREYFLANVGKVLDSDTLRKIAGISEWARRVRELRNEEGMNIVTHNDRSELKPGQYILLDAKPLPAFERDISKKQELMFSTEMDLHVKCVVLLQEKFIHTIMGGKQGCILDIL